MSRRRRFSKRQCRWCRALVTTNALGRAAHERSSECQTRYAARRAALGLAAVPYFQRRLDKRS
jgi:hypothetical protein